MARAFFFFFFFFFFFNFFLTKEYIHAIHTPGPTGTANLGFTGHIYKSIDSTTTLMKLFPLAYPSHPQVMTELC